MFHILVVDDDKNTRKLIEAVLEKEHYTVSTAENGKDALSKLDGEHIDLIILDVMMPEMDGYEATAAIRGLPNRPDASQIPIIAMTANAFAEDVQASLDAGMNGHLSKPIVMGEVVKMIARNLGIEPLGWR